MGKPPTRGSGLNTARGGRPFISGTFPGSTIRVVPSSHTARFPYPWASQISLIIFLVESISVRPGLAYQIYLINSLGIRICYGLTSGVAEYRNEAEMRSVHRRE